MLCARKARLRAPRKKHFFKDAGVLALFSKNLYSNMNGKGGVANNLFLAGFFFLII